MLELVSLVTKRGLYSILGSSLGNYLRLHFI
jgi:hypothetical protein